MPKSRLFFVAGKFGAAQGVKGAVRVISFMESPIDIFDASCWYVSSLPLEQAIPSAQLFKRVEGVDADHHLRGGTISEPSVQRHAHMSEIDWPSEIDRHQKILQLSAFSPLKWQTHPKGFAVTLPDLSDRNQAQLLTHQLIYLPLEHLKAQEVDGYYWRDLIGLSVVDSRGQDRGIISEMLETGANDVMVVTSIDKSRTLVPYIPEQVIQSIDLKSHTILLDWDFDDEPCRS